MHREDVNRHYVAPRGWLEVVEMADGTADKKSRSIMSHKSRDV